MSPNLLRTWAAFALATVAAVVVAQDLPKVSFSQPVMKASAVLQELSKQSGVHLASDPIVGNIPILVSVTDVDLMALLEKIAVATGGELKAEGSGYRLVNNDALRRAQAAKELQLVIQAFDKAKERARGNGASMPDRWDDKSLDNLVAAAQERQRAVQERLSQVQAREGARIQMFDSSVQSSTPATGAARRALDSIGSSVLASIMPGDRIVYSTAANRMQRRMPFNITPLVNDFVYNHNLLAQRAPQLQQNSNITMIGALTAGEPIQGVAETHVILSRGYRSTTISLEIKFYDRNGLAVGSGSASISPMYDAVGASVSAEGKAIELSELSRSMAQLIAQETAQPSGARNVFRMASVNGGGGSFVTVSGNDMSLPKQVPDELMEVLVNPDRRDPASLFVSEAYMQVALAEGKDLVATFPDRTLRDMARGLVAGNVTTKTVLGSSGSYGLSVEDANGWLLVTPTYPDTTRKTNFNRDQAAKFFRALHGRGFSTLEELADYSFYVTLGLPDRPLDMVYLWLINKDTATTLDEYVGFNLDLLRVYALLPDTLKRTAGERMQVQFRSLSGAAKGYAEHAYYARPTGFIMPDMQSGAQITAIMAFDVSEERNGPPPNSILNEPTEALPNGIPAEALVTVMRSLSEGVFASTKGIRGGQLMSAEELGMRQGMLSANLGGGGQMPPDYDTFVPAQIVNVEIALELAEYGRPSAMFKDGWLVSGARAVAYNQLPEAFRARVEAFKQSMMTPPPIPTEGAVRVRGGGGG